MVLWSPAEAVLPCLCDLPCAGVQIHITKPTWSNHHNIFKDAGVDKKEYSYYKPSTKGLDFEGLISDLKVIVYGP